jgi:hypothetical protein
MAISRSYILHPVALAFEHRRDVPDSVETDNGQRKINDVSTVASSYLEHRRDRQEPGLRPVDESVMNRLCFLSWMTACVQRSPLVTPRSLGHFVPASTVS